MKLHSQKLLLNNIMTWYLLSNYLLTEIYLQIEKICLAGALINH